jgi:hypothetical protein
MMEAARTSETSVDNHFTRQYNPEDSSEHQIKTVFVTMATLFIVLALVNMVTSGIPSHPHNSEVAVVIRKGERSDSVETNNTHSLCLFHKCGAHMLCGQRLRNIFP